MKLHYDKSESLSVAILAKGEVLQAMERLTRVTGTGKIWPIHGVDEALKKLAAYEDTGFTPEEIEKLKKELYLTGTYVCKPKESDDDE